MRVLARSLKSLLVAALLCAGTDAALALKCERVPDAPPAGCRSGEISASSSFA